MLGLTTLGAFHTAVGLIALVCGFIALARDRQISPQNLLGQIYLIGTLIAAVSALGIFRRGGFGPPHVLALLTIAALAVGTLAGRSSLFGGAGRYVQAVSYSSTFLFQLIPAITESSIRLPPGAPLVASIDSPVLPRVYLVLFTVFLVGVTLQVRRLRRAGGVEPVRHR